LLNVFVFESLVSLVVNLKPVERAVVQACLASMRVELLAGISLASPLMASDVSAVFVNVWPHHATLQIVAIRPLLVRLVPASTISPLRASSTRRGRCVLAGIGKPFCISSSVAPAAPR